MEVFVGAYRAPFRHYFTSSTLGDLPSEGESLRSTTSRYIFLHYCGIFGAVRVVATPDCQESAARNSELALCK